jgi:hypothetical protein
MISASLEVTLLDDRLVEQNFIARDYFFGFRINYCWLSPAQSFFCSGPRGNNDHVFFSASDSNRIMTLNPRGCLFCRSYLLLTLFRDIMPCSLIDIYRPSLDHAFILKMKVAWPSEKSISTRVHGVTSQ